MQEVLKSVKDILIPEDKVLIDLIPVRFILENGKQTNEPEGNLSKTLCVEAQIILADKAYVKDITLALKKAGIEVDGIVPDLVAGRMIILEPEELTSNVMMLDIGAGSTDIAIYEKDAFTYTNTIPVGSNNITNDIAVVLEIDYEEAEKLKKQYGLALTEYIDNDNEITLFTHRTEEGIKPKTIKSSELIEIIEARIEEIFSLVNQEITTRGLKPVIRKTIITGLGINNISKSDVVAGRVLDMPVRMVTTRAVSGVKPEFINSYAMIKYISGRPYAKTVSSSISKKSERRILKGIKEKVKDFFYS